MEPMALCRRTLGGDAIAGHFLRETHPMALFRCRYHTVVESGRKERGSSVSTVFSLGVENERADAGRDG